VLPEFAVRILARDTGERVPLLEANHPEYDQNVENWQLLIDAFEGTGGFADGEYLWPYQNERLSSYDKRKKMARYHNYVETIVDLYVRHVFTQEPARRSDSEEYNDWLKDVDGEGTTISDYLRHSVSLALSAGHAGILMDATPDAPLGPSKADQRARPFLTHYPATSITDWRTKRAAVTGIKLIEQAQAASIADAVPTGDDAIRYLLWDAEGWARFDHEGALLAAGVPGLELVPFEVLRPKPSVTRTFIGRSLFSHGKIIQALFNRMSEEDQVLRDQAFSLLTVEVSDDGDVEQAKKAIGDDVGTTVALCVKGKPAYISPDMKVPAEVRANIVQIIREIYRVAHMRYERDSLDAEAAEAIRLQFKELNEMLQGLAAELQRVEMSLARFYFAWTSATPEQAAAAFDAANVSITYPNEFFLADLRLDLDAWAQGIAMQLGETATKEIKKLAVRRIFPEATTDDLQTMEDEIDTMPAEPMTPLGDAAAKLQSGAKARLQGILQTTSAQSG
jgi:hypothetical protein